MTDDQIRQRLNELVKATQPIDGSAPLEPVLDLANFVLKYWHRIEAMLEPL